MQQSGQLRHMHRIVAAVDGKARFRLNACFPGEGGFPEACLGGSVVSLEVACFVSPHRIRCLETISPQSGLHLGYPSKKP